MDMEIDLELEMKISCRELRLFLLHKFCLGRRAMEATSNKCGTMSKNAFSVRTAQHCFYQFKNKKFEVDDLSHIGRPLQVDVGLLKQLIEEDPGLITRCLVERLGSPNTAVETYLHELGKT